MIVRRHGPSRRICVVAGHDDLLDVAALFADLPADSYGQAFLVRSAAAIPPLNCPERVMVTWLTPTSQPGDEVRSALSTWVAEWGDATPEERPVVWIGPSVRGHVADLDLRRLDFADSAVVPPLYAGRVEVPTAGGYDSV